MRKATTSIGDMVTRVRGFKKIGGNRIENKAQENTESALTPILRSKILDGVLLKNVSLNNGTTLVSHKLGRKIEGWIVVRQRSDARVWDDQDNNVNVSTTLKLQTSAAVEVDLWIF